MNPSLTLLRSTREARREAALTRLSLATREFESAYQACAQAMQSLQEAKQWRQDVAAQCVLGQDSALRDSLGPSCAALVDGRQQIFTETQEVLRQAHANVQAHRKQVAACERDTLRLEEWQKLERDQAQRAQALLEDRQDDNLPMTRQHSTRRGAP